MKIRKRGGVSSIADMTNGDLSNLAFGLSCAVAFMHRNPAGESAAWTAARIGELERLRVVLDTVERARRDGVVLLTSDDFQGPSAHYQVTMLRGLRDWDGDAPNLPVAVGATTIEEGMFQ